MKRAHRRVHAAAWIVAALAIAAILVAAIAARPPAPDNPEWPRAVPLEPAER